MFSGKVVRQESKYALHKSALLVLFTAAAFGTAFWFEYTTTATVSKIGVYQDSSVSRILQNVHATVNIVTTHTVGSSMVSVNNRFVIDSPRVIANISAELENLWVNLAPSCGLGDGCHCIDLPGSFSLSSSQAKPPTVPKPTWLCDYDAHLSSDWFSFRRIFGPTQDWYRNEQCWWLTKSNIDYADLIMLVVYGNPPVVPITSVVNISNGRQGTYEAGFGMLSDDNKLPSYLIPGYFNTSEMYTVISLLNASWYQALYRTPSVNTVTLKTSTFSAISLAASAANVVYFVIYTLVNRWDPDRARQRQSLQEPLRQQL